MIRKTNSRFDCFSLKKDTTQGGGEKGLPNSRKKIGGGGIKTK